MGRGKASTGMYAWTFTIDSETHRMIKEISKALGINNNSAVVRMAIRRLYEEVKKQS
ncbi:ribbon-helix-helix domain-containing protein [Thermococcus chitonophagus]|uniref:Ribbon-helix-helix protein CopG domain-containing protein n=1 Tax=Thermococcus chitonophagus TaxID=54262 RepID=A0A160VTU6_9EURY|nr:hypothetical protein [Thermococcus chitonophagus]CUX78209.1 hypothetical protein CHITON_1430 [Thermococcus chitonophagus]